MSAPTYRERIGVRLRLLQIYEIFLRYGSDALFDRGVAKPDRSAFLESCSRLGCSPTETLFVGDSMEVDALAARAAGLRGVWLDPDSPPRPIRPMRPATCIVCHLIDIEPAVAYLACATCEICHGQRSVAQMAGFAL